MELKNIKKQLLREAKRLAARKTLSESVEPKKAKRYLQAAYDAYLNLGYPEITDPAYIRNERVTPQAIEGYVDALNNQEESVTERTAAQYIVHLNKDEDHMFDGDAPFDFTIDDEEGGDFNDEIDQAINFRKKR